MKPFFSYYGGKQRMANKIVPLIPQHTVYVEPFCGGATIMFAKPNPVITNSHHYREVINDKNDLIVNFFKVCQENPQELDEMLKYSLYSESLHQWSKKICKGLQEPKNKIELAFAFYINIQFSFSNVLNSGLRFGIFGRNSAKSFKRDIFFPRIKDVHITNQDAVECIKRWDSPQTFFYCDPPYLNCNQGHYAGYTEDDLKNLVSTLDHCQGSFILSGYETNIIPKDCEKFEFSAIATSQGISGKGRDLTKKSDARKNAKRTECVWRRFNKVQPREEILKLYQSGKFDCYVPHPEMKKEVNQYEFSLQPDRAISNV